MPRACAARNVLAATNRERPAAELRGRVNSVEAARIELKSVRKRVARFKAEFSAGKRY